MVCTHSARVERMGEGAQVALLGGIESHGQGRAEVSGASYTQVVHSDRV